MCVLFDEPAQFCDRMRDLCGSDDNSDDRQPRPDWPNVGFDFNPVMERMTAALAAGCPGIEFIPTMANGESQAKAILDKDKTSNIDGYVVIQMNCWNRVVQTIVKSGKPVLYADFLYAGSGGFLVYTAGFVREKTPNFGFICSSQFSDVVEAAKCFSTVKKADRFAQAVAKVRKAQTQVRNSQICKLDKLELLSPSKWKEKMKKSKILTVGGEGWRGPKAVIRGIGSAGNRNSICRNQRSLESSRQGQIQRSCRYVGK